jgi:hypothetical protein
MLRVERHKKKRETGKIWAVPLSLWLSGDLAMVVSTETEVGDVTAVVGGMYDGHFAWVRGHTKQSIKLTLLHELARPWAKETANVKVTIRRPSVRVLNANEVDRVATWEGSIVAVKERERGPPITAGRGTEASLLAGLVALHISTHPEGVTEGRLAFQEILDGAIGARARGPVLRNN